MKYIGGRYHQLDTKQYLTSMSWNLANSFRTSPAAIDIVPYSWSVVICLNTFFYSTIIVWFLMWMLSPVCIGPSGIIVPTKCIAASFDPMSTKPKILVWKNIGNEVVSCNVWSNSNVSLKFSQSLVNIYAIDYGGFTKNQEYLSIWTFEHFGKAFNV